MEGTYCINGGSEMDFSRMFDQYLHKVIIFFSFFNGSFSVSKTAFCMICLG